jgi:hypothetical protein
MIHFGSVGVLLNLIIDEPFQFKITLPLSKTKAKDVIAIIIYPSLCSIHTIESKRLPAKKKIQGFFAHLSKSQ